MSVPPRNAAQVRKVMELESTVNNLHTRLSNVSAKKTLTESENEGLKTQLATARNLYDQMQDSHAELEQRFVTAY